MRSFISLFPISLFVVFFLFAFNVATGNNVIHDTCKLTSRDTSAVNYEFCKTSLKAACDETYNVSIEAQGLMSLNLIMKNATDTRSFIIKALKDNNNSTMPFWIPVLNTCLEMYSDIISDLEKALVDYKSQKYEEVTAVITTFASYISSCEDKLNDIDVPTQLRYRCENAHQLCGIALDILCALRKKEN